MSRFIVGQSYLFVNFTTDNKYTNRLAVSAGDSITKVNVIELTCVGTKKVVSEHQSDTDIPTFDGFEFVSKNGVKYYNQIPVACQEQLSDFANWMVDRFNTIGEYDPVTDDLEFYSVEKFLGNNQRMFKNLEENKPIVIINKLATKLVEDEVRKLGWSWTYEQRLPTTSFKVHMTKD